MPPMVHGDMEANPWLPGIYLCNNSSFKYNQKTIPEPSMHLHKTSKRGGQWLQNENVEKIHLFQAKPNLLLKRDN